MKRNAKKYILHETKDDPALQAVPTSKYLKLKYLYTVR